MASSLHSAALVVTFYYDQRSWLTLQPLTGTPPLTEPRPLTDTDPLTSSHLLISYLLSKLTWTPETADSKWINAAEQRVLHQFRLSHPAAHDTGVIQLSLEHLTPTADASTGWRYLARQLQAIFHGADEAIYKHLFGCTLVYQAVIDSSPDINQYLWNDIWTNETDKQLNPTDNQWVSALRVGDDPARGRLWLAYTPQGNQGLETATIYVAVNLQAVNNDFVTETIFGRRAKLLLPDLIAHKSYHQIRQQELVKSRDNYDVVMSQARTAAITVLRSSKAHTAIEDTALSDKYQRLIGTVAQLSALQISLAKQLFNYTMWSKNPVYASLFGQLMDLHHDHMVAGAEELKLEVEEGRSVLDSVDTAISIVQTKIEAIKANQQNTLEMLVAVASAALAAPQLIDPTAAQAILNGVNGTFSPSDMVRLTQVGIQLGFVVIFMILALGLVRWLKPRF